MKTILLFLLTSQMFFAQKHFTRTGTTVFKASVDAFEPVEATNHSTSAIITNTGDIAIQLFIRAFKFKIALMEEHFNENYMDSDKYPKATFIGKIENFDINNVNSEKEFTITGVLTIRNIKNKVKTIGRLVASENKVRLASSFSVFLKDYNIKIPSIVRKKISQKVNIHLNYELSKKK